MNACYDCGRPYGDEGFSDLIIPNSVWRQISPTGDDGGLLCPCCIIRRCAKAGISRVPAAFMSGPLDGVSCHEMQAYRMAENCYEQRAREEAADGKAATAPLKGHDPIGLCMGCGSRLTKCGLPFTANIQCRKCGRINVYENSRQPTKLIELNTEPRP